MRVLQAKNVMFNLNESHRIVMSQSPSDMRMGVDCLCGQVRSVGLDQGNEDGYCIILYFILHRNEKNSLFSYYIENLKSIFMRKGLFCFVWVMLCVWTPAQNIQDSIVSYFNSMVSTPQEKLYLHLDKPYYGAGEKIWFRGYLLNAVTHQDNMPENFITVELINRTDSVILRKKIARDSMGFHNALVLPATLSGGEYYLRGYSNWMRNIGPDFFYMRRLRIGNAIDRNVVVSVNYKPTDGEEWLAEIRFAQPDGSVYDNVLVKCRLYEEGKLKHRIVLRTDEVGRIQMKLPDLNKAGKRRIEVEFDDPVYLYSNTLYIPEYSKDFDVRFFPEGGALLEGVPQKIAFKSQGADGFSCEVAGTLFNAEGDTLGRIRTEHNGMGLFNLSARPDETYFAEFVSSDGVVRRFELPKAVKQGFSLSIAERKGTLLYRAQKTEATVFPDELYLVAHTRGRLFAIQKILPEQPFGRFDTALLDDGITHFLLVDKGGKVLSERLFFYYHPQQSCWDITADQEKYAPRSPVTLHIQAKDSIGNPVQGNFSVSITDAGCVKQDSSADHIVSNLLLTSDLKGYVENPADYFKGQDARTLYNVDLLMMTHGWRRHILTNVAHWEKINPKYFLECGQTLSGHITGLFGGKVKRGPIVAVAPRQGILETVETDKQGRFVIPIAFPDSTKFLIQARTKLGFAGVGIHVDEQPVPPVYAKIPFSSQIAPFPDTYLMNTLNQYYAEGGMRVINMKEMVVTAQNKRYEKSMYVGINDKTYDSDELLESGATTVWDALQWLPGVEISDTGGVKLTRCEGTPLFIVNDVTYADGESILSSYSPEEVHSLSLVKDGSANIFGLRGSGGAIVVTLKHPMDFPAKPTPGIITYSPLGYALGMEFYHPVYDTPERKGIPNPDMRSTLYWNPCLKLDCQGCAEITYYTSDSGAPHDIVIEGVGRKGRVHHYVKRINK